MKLFSAFLLSFTLLVGCSNDAPNVNSSNRPVPASDIEPVINLLEELKYTIDPKEIIDIGNRIDEYDNLIILNQGKSDCTYLDCFGVYLTTTEKLAKAFQVLGYEKNEEQFLDIEQHGFKKLVEVADAYKIGTTREEFLEYVNIHGMYPHGNSGNIYVIWSSDRIKDFEDL